MGLSTMATSLLVGLAIGSISLVTCNPSKRQTLETASADTAECVADPGKARRTELLEGAATTWAATLPPMLVTMQEMSQTMKLERNPPAEMSNEPSGMDCTMLYAKGHNTSGIYKIGHHDLSITPHEPFYVYCDMETDGGGWTVFQKRFDGSTNFYRGWEAYDEGFGHVDGEQWLGLEKLNLLTSFAKYELRVDLESFDGEAAFAKYANFEVGDEFDGHHLSVSGYGSTGTAGDALTNHNQKAFSTKDRDNDASSICHSAAVWGGAWWFSDCQSVSSNLNGRYSESGSNARGMVWQTWKRDQGLKASTMMIRNKRSGH